MRQGFWRKRLKHDEINVTAEKGEDRDIIIKINGIEILLCDVDGSWFTTHMNASEAKELRRLGFHTERLDYKLMDPDTCRERFGWHKMMLQPKGVEVK